MSASTTSTAAAARFHEATRETLALLELIKATLQEFASQTQADGPDYGSVGDILHYRQGLKAVALAACNYYGTDSEEIAGTLIEEEITQALRDEDERKDRKATARARRLDVVRR